jgi:hypothetical protein
MACVSAAAELDQGGHNPESTSSYDGTASSPSARPADAA